MAVLGRHPARPNRRSGALKTDGSACRLLDRAQVARYADELRVAGKTVVFTNGVFDLLHPGHVRYLERARRLGDKLIVGLNADASVRRSKGPDRPINPEEERSELLAALDCVDAVVVFEEDTPAEIIRAVQPDILVKGADWPADQIVGRDTVEARGGRVVLMEVELGHSTTAIIDRIRRQTGTSGTGR
jgi:D-beta-D-heptose 7-phosphate kinase/D-beta-D-heptose 1-phosphate adenosyltransferase